MTSRLTWRKVGWVCLGLAGGVAFVWLVVIRLVSKFHERGPCPYAVAWLVDNPYRRRQVGPLLDRIGIRPGERVLELGPGPGAFTVAAAQRAEPGGSLVAVDIQPAMIAAVERRVQQVGLTNVETRVAGAHDLPLDSESVDRAFLVTVLGEIPDRQRALAELRRVLKPGGILSITEQFLDPDYPLAATVIRWADEAGFKLSERYGNWWTYTLNFCKPG